MKLFKKIVYTLLGLTMAGTIGLIGVILFAEYKGQLFKMNAASDLADEESRLVYDENGNLAELPGGIIAGEDPAAAGTDGSTDAASPDAAQTPESPAADAGTANSPAGEVSQPSAADTAATDTAADTGEEHTYIMNKESSIFHLDTCPDIANISDDNKLSMTSTRDMVTGRGYQPCMNCNP